MKYKILAIDPGSKKVGLALSDDSQMIAFAFETWILDDNFTAKLSKLIEDKNIQQIVVGKKFVSIQTFRLSNMGSKISGRHKNSVHIRK